MFIHQTYEVSGGILELADDQPVRRAVGLLVKCCVSNSCQVIYIKLVTWLWSLCDV